MTSFSKSKINSRMKRLDESVLLEQLKEVFRQNFHNCQRLAVFGILSYTIDDNSEQFLKLDFSTTKGSGLRDSNAEIETHEICCIENREFTPRKPPHNLEILQDPNDFKEATSPANASPPLLPPLVIQNSRVTRGATMCSTPTAHDTLCSLETDEIAKDVVDGPLHRRDRRKSRRPKRQIVDSENRNADSEVEDGGTEQDEAVSSSDPEVFRPGKIPRIVCSLAAVTSNPNLVFSSNNLTSAGQMQDSTAVAPEVSHQLIEQLHIPNSEPSGSTSQVTFGKFNDMCSQGTDFLPQATSATKYTIATKTLGLGDLGEFCGLLPLNSIINRTILSCNDNNSLTVKVAPSSSGTPNPLIIPVPDAASHMHTNQGMIPVTTNGASTHNVLLNPNLAAAVAAALSVPSQSQVTTPTYSDQQGITGITSFNGPSIALTGPSGELIGTIPIGTTGQQHGLLPSVLGTALASHASSTVSATNTPNVSVPLSSCANSGSSLATTLNWLRCASASAEIAHLNSQAAQPSVSTNGQIQTTNNSVALLQSLAGQNTVHQLGSTPGKVSSISVGPTLALIGTLGLNPVPSTSSSVLTNTESLPSTASGTTNATLLTTNLGLGSSNSNAALVAAALLRGLSGAKGTSTDVTESPCLETGVSGLPGAVTLITGGQMPPGSLATGRPNLIPSDGTLTSLGSILSSKVSNSTSGAPTTSNFSIFDSPACTATSLNRIGQNQQLINGATGAVTRGSIMLSYPRGQGEMNLLLTPASAQSLNSSSLSSMATVPTAISFQSILTPQTTSIALASPVLLQTQLSNSVGSKTTTTVCTTSTVSSTLSVSPSVLPPIRSKNNPPENKPSPDPTASAIDRILQTIKGCMNNENRENDAKQKFVPPPLKKNENSGNTSGPRSNTEEAASELSTSGESKQSYSLKLTSVSVPIAKPTSGVTQLDQSTKAGDGSKSSIVTGERVPLAPLTKESNDHEAQPSCRVTKVYRCRYCGKTFNRKFCRERHERLHTGVKPYTCEICEEKFIRLEDKKRHVRSLQHYLAGRGSFIKSESGDVTGEEAAALGIDPTTVLPLLAQTLQTSNQDGMNGNLGELEDAVGLSASEDTSNDQGSDCESFDAEESPEKTSNEFQNTNQTNIRIGTPDDSSDAPELRHTPVSYCEEDNAPGLPGGEVPCGFVDNQSSLMLPTGTPTLTKDESHLTPTSKTANVVSLASVVLLNSDDVQSSIPSS